MDKIEIRAVIKYLCIKHFITEQMFKDLCVTLGQSAPRHAEFRRGRTSVTQEMVEKVLGNFV